MRKIIACVLTIIYLGFTAGAVLHIPTNEASDSLSIESSYDDNSNVSDEELPTSHLEVLNFHKSHKHLAATRAFEIQRVNFITPSVASHISSINAAFRRFAAITVLPVLDKADIFIKNCVLRV